MRKKSNVAMMRDLHEEIQELEEDLHEEILGLQEDIRKLHVAFSILSLKVAATRED